MKTIDAAAKLLELAPRFVTSSFFHTRADIEDSTPSFVDVEQRFACNCSCVQKTNWKQASLGADATSSNEKRRVEQQGHEGGGGRRVQRARYRGDAKKKNEEGVRCGGGEVGVNGGNEQGIFTIPAVPARSFRASRPSRALSRTHLRWAPTRQCPWNSSCRDGASGGAATQSRTNLPTRASL